MKTILVLVADWANGIFSVLLAVLVTGHEAAWWHFLVGMVLSHVPDLDALPELWRRGRVVADNDNPYDHRDGLHYPLVTIGGAVLAIGLFGYWGWVLGFAIALHYLNDLYGTGWGIKLLWPFSKRNYKFFARRVNQPKQVLIARGDWDGLSNQERRLQFIVSWTAEELPSYLIRWGMDNWITVYYLRLNIICVVEYVLFGAALLGMVWYLVL